jgi:mannose-1-phosphate guanylyltransferase
MAASELDRGASPRRTPIAVARGPGSPARVVARWGGGDSVAPLRSGGRACGALTVMLPREQDSRKLPHNGFESPRALLLTAGLGTRLRPLTYVRAKPAVPVNGETLVGRILTWLIGFGVREVVLNLHHRPESVAAVVGDGSDLGVRVRYSWEQPVLGSAGGPRHALPLLTDDGRERFLLVNGDTLSNVDVRAMLDAHASSRAQVTMALIPNPRPDKYGGVRLSRSGHVTGFTRAGTLEESFHFVGVQVAEARAFASLEDGKPAESVNMLYPKLLAHDARSVAGFVSAASFRDIGTPADYLETSLALADVEGARLGEGRGVSVSPSAEVIRTALWDDVTVGPGARLADCIVCDGVHVPAGARYVRSAIVKAEGIVPAKDERVEGELLVRAI